jgi:ammonia channel protein AmtB
MSVIWFVFGYSMCFGPSAGSYRSPDYARVPAGIDLTSMFAGDANLGIPTLVHVAYQMMFAIIAPALIPEMIQLARARAQIHGIERARRRVGAEHDQD